jgi:hypothetical protein
MDGAVHHCPAATEQGYDLRLSPDGPVTAWWSGRVDRLGRSTLESLNTAKELDDRGYGTPNAAAGRCKRNVPQGLACGTHQTALPSAGQPSSRASEPPNAGDRTILLGTGRTKPCPSCLPAPVLPAHAPIVFIVSEEAAAASDQGRAVVPSSTTTTDQAPLGPRSPLLLELVRRMTFNHFRSQGRATF